MKTTQKPDDNQKLAVKLQSALLGYVVAAIIGAIFFILIGYLIYSIPTSYDGVVRLQVWMSAPWTYRVPHWMFLGVAIGLGLR